MNERQRHELRKPARPFLQRPQRQQVARPMNRSLHMAEHDRGRTAQADIMRGAHDIEPLFRRHLVGADDVADIVASVDESVDATRCGGKADCQGGEMCLTHELWSDLSDQIHSFLKGVNLASLVQKNQVRAIATKQTLDQYDQIGIQAVQLTD